MTKEETKKAIEVMQAFVDGKEVQGASKQSGEWITLTTDMSPLWDWHRVEYRIKPEPMEIEVWVSPDGRLGRIVDVDEPHSADGWTKKKFREVV